MSKQQYSVQLRGQKFTDSFRAFFKDSAGNLVSPFHDIPLTSSDKPDVFNMVVEVSRWSNAKMEINKDEPLNPIKQDVKKGKMRFVANLFPYHGYPWNYGAIPQTWENPSDTDAHTGCVGDNDPLDVCDISDIVSPLGGVIEVKVLGVLAMIDEGETDWKVIVVNCADPLADQLNDIMDVEKVKPGLLAATVDWFRDYKVPDGKPKNNFAFDGQFKDKQFALDIIKETNGAWKKLIVDAAVGQGKISLANTTLADNSALIGQEKALEVVNSTAAPTEDAVLAAAVESVFFMPATAQS